MTVHLAGNLPADDLNGLVAAEAQLVDGYLARQQHLVIGVVRVTGTKRLDKEGFKDNPIVSFDRIEAVPDALHGEAVDLLTRIYRSRTGGSTLDFPEDDMEPSAPLELEGLDDAGYRFVIEDDTKGKFLLRVLAPSGAVALERRKLPRREYGEIPPGEYQLVHIEDDGLRSLAESLVAEYESGFAEEAVDAEVVDDEDES